MMSTEHKKNLQELNKRILQYEMQATTTARALEKHIHSTRFDKSPKSAIAGLALSYANGERSAYHTAWMLIGDFILNPEISKSGRVTGKELKDIFSGLAEMADTYDSKTDGDDRYCTGLYAGYITVISMVDWFNLDCD